MLLLSLSYFTKKLIQIFRDKRMITGKKTTRVITMVINTVFKLASKKKKEMTKAATAKAIPTA